MGKKCDLCNGIARIYCESDQASLCFSCDGNVHGANFLVAKHTRCLLCSACQSLTPWKATGLRLSPTFSVCDSCFAIKNGDGGSRILSESQGGQEEVNSFNSEEERIREESEDDDEDEEYSDDDEEEVENQVVPAQSPPVMSSSSSDGGLVTKRTREYSDLLCSDDEIGSSSSSRVKRFSAVVKR